LAADTARRGKCQLCERFCQREAATQEDCEHLMQAEKKQILNRLATIEGHLGGIYKMVEDDVCCVDVLKQSYAVERAMKAFEAALLQGHLASCLPTGFNEQRDDVIREVRELCELSRR
jgi:DNA-binding FrmR family transcriptional regulator